MECATNSIYDHFQTIANQHPHKTACITLTNGQIVSISYKELLHQVTLYQQALLSWHLSPGDRIGLLAHSSPFWATAYLACLSLNLTVVCLDPGLPCEQLIELLGYSDCRLLITSEELYENFSTELASLLPTLNIINKLLPMNAITLRDSSPQDTQDIASILFTSGTIGGFKGVLLSQEAILFAVHAVTQLSQGTNADNVICLLPAHHIYALVCVILSPLLVGASITFVEKIDGTHILEALNIAHPTMLVGVPRLYDMLTSHIIREIEKKPRIMALLITFLLKSTTFLRRYTGINLGKYLFTSVHQKLGGHIRLLISGAASLSPEIYYVLYGLGFTILEGYGLTETSATVVVNTLEKQKAGSVGKALPDVHIKIFSADSQGAGEICIKAPSLMRGYLNNPQATERALQQGWYHTGDLGYIDKEGYLFITGRIKEIIVLGNGKKVSPCAIESKLKNLPYVIDYGIVGIKDNHSPGENIHLGVVVDHIAQASGHDYKKDIQDALEKIQSKLPSWYCIHDIHFIDNIPRTNTLKIKRKLLAEKILHQVTAESSDAPKKNLILDQTPLENEVMGLMKPILASSSIPISLDSSFHYDLGFDSIGMSDLITKIQNTFGITISRAALAGIFRVTDLIRVVENEIENKSINNIADVSNQHHLEDIAIQNTFMKHTQYRGIKKVVSHGLSCATQFLFAQYFHYSFSGLEKLDKNKCYIIAANHCSHLDNPALLTALHTQGINTVSAGAKDYFFHNRMNAMISSLFFKMIPFERDMDNAALQRNLNYMELCKKHHLSVLIFPEGTRSLTGELGPFKSGVALFSNLLNMDILPAYIDGTFQCLPKGKLFPTRGKIHVNFGEPIKISQVIRPASTQYSPVEYREFMRHLQERILTLRPNHHA